MTGYPSIIGEIIERLARLPGLGRRSAERIALFFLEADPSEVEALASAIARLRREVRHCSKCRNIATTDLCEICASPKRDKKRICVVEMPHDVSRIEDSEAYRGLYHVLLGKLSPDTGQSPEDLGINELLERIKQDGVEEVILATNPNMAGDATADYLTGILRAHGVKITRPARGLPAGSEIEFLRREALMDAFRNREVME